jgi:hypothetical protein
MRGVARDERARRPGRERPLRETDRRRETRAQRAEAGRDAELTQSPQRQERIERSRREQQRLDGGPTRRERPEERPVSRRVGTEAGRRLVDVSHE